MRIPTVNVGNRFFPQPRPARHFAVSLGLHLLRFLLIALLLCLTAGFALMTSNYRELERRLLVLNLHYELARDVQVRDVTVDPRGTIRITGLSVASDQPDPQPFFAIERCDIRFDPLRLGVDPLHPINAVQQITLDRPFVKITRGPQGRWNFADLLATKTSSSRFQGEVVMTGGEVIYRDAFSLGPGRRIDEHLVNVSARMTRAGDNYMPFRLTGMMQDGHARAVMLSGGIQRQDNRIMCQVRLGEVDLAYIQQFLPTSMPVTLQAGHADARWQLTVAPDPKTKGMTAVMTILADLHQLRGQLRLHGRQLPLQIDQGQFRYALGIAELVGCRGVCAGLPVQVDGTISHFANPLLALRLETKQADATTLARVLPGLAEKADGWKGTVSGWVQLTGYANAVQLAGHLTAPELAMPFPGLRKVTALSTDLALQNDALVLSRIDAQAYGGHVTGTAWLDARASETASASANTMVLFRGSVEGAQAEQLVGVMSAQQTTPTALPPIHGTLSGPLSLTVAHDRSMSLVTSPQGDLTVGDMAQGHVETSVRLQIPNEGQARATIDRMLVRAPEGIFRVQGTAGSDAVALTVQGSQISLQQLARRFHREDLTGTGYLSGTISGAPNRLAFTGFIRAKDGSFADRQFADLSGTVQVALGDAPKATLGNIRLISGQDQVELAAAQVTIAPKGSDWANGEWHVQHVTLARTSLSALAAFLGVKLQLDGFAEGMVEYADLPTDTRSEGQLILRRPSVHIGDAQLELDRATITFAVRDFHTLDIKQAVLEYQGLPGEGDAASRHKSVITLKGRLSIAKDVPADQQLSLDIDGADLPVRNFTAFNENAAKGFALGADGRLYLPVEVSGTINVHGHVSARLIQDAGATDAAAAFKQSLRAAVSVTGGSDFNIAQVPYRQFTAALDYSGKDQTLGVSQFTLGPGGDKRTYLLALSAPSAFHLASPSTVDLHLALQADQRSGDERKPADLGALRDDLIAIADNMAKKGDVYDVVTDDLTALPTSSQLQGYETNLPKAFRLVTQYLRSIPEPFAGRAVCRVDVTDALERPVITTQLAVNDLVMAGQSMPSLLANGSYNTASRKVSIDQMTAKGGVDPNAVLAVVGTVGIPGVDTLGKEDPGSLEIRADAQNINPSLLAHWFPGSGLSALGGEVNIHIDTLPNATPTAPQFEASLDWDTPTIGGVALDAIHTMLMLENDPSRPGAQRLWIGQHLRKNGYGIIQLKQANSSTAPPLDALPLEISGYLPVRWGVPHAMPIATNEPFEFNLRIPAQGLGALKAYAPDLLKQVTLPQDGSMSGRIHLAGTLDKMTFCDDSFARLDVPEIRVGGGQYSEQIANAVLSLGMHSEGAGDDVANVIDINDLSALYRPTTKLPKSRSGSVFDSLKKLVGIRVAEKVAPQPSLAVGGEVRILTPKEGWSAYLQRMNGDLVDGIYRQSRYDVYARGLDVPLQLGNPFRGVITGYVHLGNRAGTAATPTPVLTGVIYAKDSTIAYTSSTDAPFVWPKFAFNPDLSLFVQVGSGNRFMIQPEHGILSGSTFAEFPLVSTGPNLFAPDAVADPVKTLQPAEGKPYLDRSPLYMLTADTLDAIKSQAHRNASDGDPDYQYGSYGRVTGTLSRPDINLTYVLEPGKSQVQLPGGLIVVQSGYGNFIYQYDESKRDFGTRLEAHAVAQGTLDDYVIKATIDEDNVMDQEGGRLPLTLSTVSSPPGSQPLSDSEIYARLIGMPDFIALLQGKEGVFSPIIVSKLGPNMLFSSWMHRFASAMSLETFSLRLDPTWNAEATITTPELPINRWSTIRLGATRNFADVPTWRVWFDYRLPTNTWLRNLSVTGDMNNQNTVNIGLQYQLRFNTSSKEKDTTQ